MCLVCEMLMNGVSGVFGPSAGDTAPIVQSICDYKEIPHIQTRWDINQKRGSCQINLYPHPSTLAEVIVTFMLTGNHRSLERRSDFNYTARRSSIWSPLLTGKALQSSTKTTTVSCRSPISLSHLRPLIRFVSGNLVRGQITGKK